MGIQKKYKPTPELLAEICTRIALGESLRSICRDKGKPSPGVVCAWLANDKQFSEQYTRAREAQAETLAEETLEIADTPAERTKDGLRDSAHVNQKRLQVDARKWFASKVYPKKYGESMTHKGDAENPFVTKTTDQLKADLIMALALSASVETE